MDARPSGPPAPRAPALATASALVLGALVLWRCGVAILALPAELRALAPQALARSLARPLEKRLLDTIPLAARDFAALVETTPPEACILVPRATDQKGATWPSLRSLYFPRRFRVFDPEVGWAAEPGTYLLVPVGSGPEDGDARAERLERRGGLELWLARVPEAPR